MGLMKRFYGNSGSGGANLFQNPVMGMRINTSLSFFDTTKITEAVKRGDKKTLSYFGSYVQKAAKWSIRTHKGYSAPGQPPYSHTGLLKRFIFYFYDRLDGNVVIGPTLLKQGEGSPTVPEVLEHGGSRIFKDRMRKKGGGYESRLKRAVYRARPYMQPAFETAKAKLLPDIWKDSVK